MLFAVLYNFLIFFSGKYGSASPVRRSLSPRRTPSPNKSPLSREGSPDVRNAKTERSASPPKSLSPRGRRDSRSPSPHDEADVSIPPTLYPARGKLFFSV